MVVELIQVAVNKQASLGLYHVQEGGVGQHVDKGDDGAILEVFVVDPKEEQKVDWNDDGVGGMIEPWRIKGVQFGGKNGLAAHREPNEPECVYDNGTNWHGQSGEYQVPESPEWSNEVRHHVQEGVDQLDDETLNSEKFKNTIDL